MKKTISHLFAAICICFIALHSTVAQPKVGLVLGGGGAKGGAEVGALKVIERAGIKVDYIAGTSIGAIIGALYAAGYSASQIEALFCQQEWFSLLTDRNEKYGGEPYKTVNGVTYIFGFPVIDLNSSVFGVFRGSRVEQVIDSLLAYHGDCVEFENLKIPFACVAAEMLTASEVVLNSGTVPQAVRASMAIPGIFKPVNINGRKLIDGGMMNNLPVDVVRQMGADIVIAIDVQQEKPQNKKKSENSLLDLADMVGLGGIAGWVINRPDITKYNENRANADLYVNPALPDYEATNFNNEKMAQMISIGEQVMMQHWNELVDVWEKTHQR